MTKSLFLTLLLATVLSAASSAPVRGSGVESGQPAPDFTFKDLAGRTQKLSDHRGKVVILEWTNPGCTVVVRHYRSGNMPATQALAQAQGAIWLQINSSAMGDMDPAKSAEWQKKQGVIANAYIRDPAGILGRLYGAEATPHVYVISKDGTLVYQGAIDDQPNASQAMTSSAHNYVKAALAALQAGVPLETAATKAYGCSVKYSSEQ